MRSRTFGILLPAALAAATVTAIGTPASAQVAPPPAEETYTEEECAQAVKILSYFKLLPNQPDVGRALCSLNIAKQEDETRPDEYTSELDTKYTAESGETVQENKLLGLPVQWPKSLTVYVPTTNDRWHAYTATKN